MNDFAEMINDLIKVRRRAERYFKHTGGALGTYEDGYLSAMNYTITRINAYVEKKKRDRGGKTQ